jgi:hypothetical protein
MKLKRRCEDNTKTNLREVVYESVDVLKLGPVYTFFNSIINVTFSKSWEFLYQLSSYKLFKKAPS